MCDKYIYFFHLFFFFIEERLSDSLLHFTDHYISANSFSTAIISSVTDQLNKATHTLGCVLLDHVTGVINSNRRMHRDLRALMCQAATEDSPELIWRAHL